MIKKTEDIIYSAIHALRPEEKTEQDWLGEQVAAFKIMLKARKEAENA